MYNYRSTISLKVNLPGVLRGKHLGVKCLEDTVCCSDRKVSVLVVFLVDFMI